MTAVAEEEAQRSVADCIAATAKGPVLLEQDDRPVAALISMEDFEIVRKANVTRALAAMEALGTSLRGAAAAEGISLDELEKMLDRHAV
jgi:PHD/YefM family antitoxin component YafN of YafNO toxin-antitoxin module